jgi:hypothetical protein
VVEIYPSLVGNKQIHSSSQDLLEGIQDISDYISGVLEASHFCLVIVLFLHGTVYHPYNQNLNPEKPNSICLTSLVLIILCDWDI